MCETHIVQLYMDYSESWIIKKAEHCRIDGFELWCWRRLFRVLSNESALCIMWPKYWSFSFNITPSNEHSGLISFRMDWLDLLAVQRTLKSLLQYHISKASILWHSAVVMVQLSNRYMTTGKPIHLTTQTSVGKVMSLLLNTLPRFVIAFLLSGNHLVKGNKYF